MLLDDRADQGAVGHTRERHGNALILRWNAVHLSAFGQGSETVCTLIPWARSLEIGADFIHQCPPHRASHMATPLPPPMHKVASPAWRCGASPLTLLLEEASQRTSRPACARHGRWRQHRSCETPTLFGRRTKRPAKPNTLLLIPFAAAAAIRKLLS